MIKIGFLLLRDTFLKTMGSLIQESLKAGHGVVLLYDEQSATGSKAYQQVTRQKLFFFEKSGAELFSVNSKDLNKLSEYGVDVLVVLEGFHFFRDQINQLEELRNTGTKIVSLTHFFENAQYPLEALNHFDKTYYLSSFAVDTHFFLNGKNSAEIKKNPYASRFEISGSPMFDQLKNLNEGEIRRELGIPPTKKIVVFFAPVVNTATDWRFFLWKQKNKFKRFMRVLAHRRFEYVLESLYAPTLREIGKDIRDFCDRNEAFLIIKSRLKQDDGDIFREIADLYLSGEHESYYPVFSSYRVLAIADLCIAAMSMAVLEAAALSVPVVNIYIPPTEYRLGADSLGSSQIRYLNAILSINKESPFSYANCVTSVDKRKFPHWIRRKELEDIVWTEEAQSSYTKRFLGFSEESSSARILRSLVHLCRV